MSSLQLISKLSTSYDQLSRIELSVIDFVAENGDIVEHIADNWGTAFTPGFWSRYFKLRIRKRKLRKLTSKFMTSILSVDSSFVMDVQTVKTWRDIEQTPFVSFSDTEILALYDTIIALRHDARFLDGLKCVDSLLFDYFLDKVPYIQRNRDFYSGRAFHGPLQYPNLRDLISEHQEEINQSLKHAALLGVN